jgi:hypothetical protein
VTHAPREFPPEPRATAPDRAPDQSPPPPENGGDRHAEVVFHAEPSRSRGEARPHVVWSSSPSETVPKRED